MSEPPSFDANPDYSIEFSADVDKTQPTSEIQSVLEKLNQQNQSFNGEEQPQEVLEVPQTPPSEWDVLREQLREKPHDPDGWKKLVDVAENSGEIEKIKETYEALLESYPNTVNEFLFDDRYVSADLLFSHSLQHRSRTSTTS